MRISDWSSDVCSSDLLQDSGSVWKFGLWALAHHASILDMKGQLAAQAIARRHTAMAKQNRLASLTSRGCSRVRLVPGLAAPPQPYRSEERRVGKVCGST